MIFEIMRIALEHGASVHVVLNDWGSAAMVKRLARLNATWSYTWLETSLKRAQLTPMGVFAYAREFWRSSMDLLRAASRVRPRRVLVVDYSAALRNAFALLFLRWTGVPVIMKLQNAPESAAFYRRLLRWLVNPLISTFVCNSQFTHDALAASGVPRRKTTIIYNTVPNRTVVGMPRARCQGRIVYVGQVIPEKGLGELLDAVEILIARGLGVSLDVVGAIDDWGTPDLIQFRKRIRARVDADPLRGRVRLAGFQENVHQYLSAATVHCCPSLPSIREAFGLVVLEAKYAGVPSVVFNSGALPELVTHDVDGWICREPTGMALADGLAHFLERPAAAAAAGVKAFESTARFSRDQFVDGWWMLLSDREAQMRPPVPFSEVV